MVTIMARVTEDVTAPPTPWRKRAPSSIAGFCARPHSSEAAVNRTRPVTKTRLRPKRSPKRPASSRNPPNGIRYAFTTQPRPDADRPRLSCMAGSATFTMVPSRMTINWPAQRIARASRREVVPPARGGTA
ncbi:hypothetical protein SFUMM280S_09982 [Streptomyces fumanus]